MTGADDMVARIAAIILDTEREHPMERGRAVLRTMLKPSAAMLRAKTRIADSDEDIWKTMINAALDAEPPPDPPKAVTQR